MPTVGVSYRCANEPARSIEWVGEGITDLLGYDADTLESDDVRFGRDIVHPDDKTAVWGQIQMGIADGTGYSVVYRAVSAEGEYTWLRDDGRAVREDSRIIALEGTLSTVESIDRPLQSLSFDRTLLASVLDELPAHIYIKDQQARHVMVSSAFVDPTDFLGKTDLELTEFVSEAHARQALEDDRRVLEDGERITNKEEYLPKRDQWNLTSKVPWTNADGEVIGVIGISQDITDRKDYAEQLEAQTERLNQFAQVVSHDLRNYVMKAHNHLELADVESERVDRAIDSIEAIDDFVDDMLDLAETGQLDLERETVPLREVATNAWATVETKTATLELNGSFATVEADPDRLQELLENLFRNAVEHGGADVTVTMEMLDDETGFYVADDGAGVPDRIQSRIFDTGFSTREAGTGFGLAIADEIASAHNWSISVTDADSGGARLDVSGVDIASSFGRE